MKSRSQRGTILTFYSFKGGAGRSMALANVARLFAREASRTGQRVLAVDWDLEAPGLHHYLLPSRDLKPDHPGLIDYCTAAQRSRSQDRLPGYRRFVTPTPEPGLDLLKAGRFGREYSARVSSFDWHEFFARSPRFFAALRTELAGDYKYVLIDSRTGVADTAGICTVLLPDKLAVLFAPNDQNLEGLKEIIPSAIRQRRSSPDERPLVVFPVPSRVDTQVFRGLSGLLDDFRLTLAEIFQRAYALQACDLREHFEQVMLPYVPDYSFGEPRVVEKDEPGHPGSLKAAYGRLAERLLLDVPWKDA
jgi:cellulose biosynthesis protein BcsQ